MIDNPLYGPNSLQILNAGAKAGYRIRDLHEWWRLIWPVFMHTGTMHLLINIAVFRSTAHNLEDEYGAKKVAIIFFFSGLFGNLLSNVLVPHLLTTASGAAVMGMIGASLADICLFWNFLESRYSLFFTNLFSSLPLLVVGCMPYQDAWSLIGGLISGFLLGYCILGKQGSAFKLQGAKVMIFVILLVSSVILLIGAWADYGFCASCTKLSCVETPIWNCPPVDCMIHLSNGTSISLPWSNCGI
jgi:membrane associated rhomboid family serine protease